MTASAGAQPLLDPATAAWTPAVTEPTAPVDAVAPATGRVGAPRPAGASAVSACVVAQAAARSDCSHSRAAALGRSLRRLAGADPLAPAAAGHYVDAVGRREVGRRLNALRRRSGPGAPWHLLHDVPLGDLAADPAADLAADPAAEPAGPATADHVLVGPAGVHVVTTLHLPGSRVRATPAALVVDGRSEPHLRRAQRDARALAALLRGATGRDVPVRAVVVVLGADRLALPLRSRDVAVLRAPVLVRWLRRQPHVLDAAAAGVVATAVRTLADNATTTAVAAVAAVAAAAATADGQPTAADAFEDLHRAVRTADRLRRAWFVVGAVAGSTAVTTLLAAVTP